MKNKKTDKLFKKLPKAEQKRINNLNRIPVAPPTVVHEGRKDKPRKRRWDEDSCEPSFFCAKILTTTIKNDFCML